MKNILRSTTSLGLSIALALPHGAIAQNEMPQCRTDGEQTEFPCVLNDEVLGNSDRLAKMLAPEAELEGAVGAEADTEVQSDAAEAGSDGDANAAANAETAEEQPSEEDVEAASEGLKAAEEAQQAAQAEAEEAQAQVDAEAVEAEAKAAAEEAAEEVAQEAAETEAAAAEAKAATEEAEAQVEAEAQAEAQMEAEAEAEESQAEEAQAEAETEAEVQAQAEADTEATEAEAQAKADDEQREARRAERQAELDAAAAAAEAADSGDVEAEVVTEEVTEESVRSSDEEFDTAVTGNEAQATSGDDDDGLSKFEKALLLGLGAVVVGSVLKNGDRVVNRSGDRLVVEDPSGDLRVLKDDDALIRRPGDTVRTETFDDGSTRTIVTKPDGAQIITIRGRDGSVLRRINVDAQGNEYVLFDDLANAETEVIVENLPRFEPEVNTTGSRDEAALRAALQAREDMQVDRRFSLRQVREINQVRALAPELELDAVRFETGSAAIRPEQARNLAEIGTTLRRMIAENPRTVILVEGHTDAVGDATYNLALSDRRAETVALALTEYFNVPPENMITQGYGESALKVETQSAERANRRAVVRNITNLLR